MEEVETRRPKLCGNTVPAAGDGSAPSLWPESALLSPRFQPRETVGVWAPGCQGRKACRLKPRCWCPRQSSSRKLV